MKNWVKWVFLVDAIGGAILGLALLIVPGRSLGLFGWSPIDPIISRILGAAVLALGWGSFTGWRLVRATAERPLEEGELAQLGLRLQMDVIFTVLASVGMLRHLAYGQWPWYAWALLVILALFAVAFGVSLIMVWTSRQRA